MIIQIVALIISVLVFALGYNIMNIVTDNSKSIEEENKSIYPLGLWLVIPSSIVLIIVIGCLLMFSTKLGKALQSLKYIIALTIVLLIVSIFCGALLLSNTNDTTLDAETKNDNFTRIGLWLSMLGSTTFSLTLYNFFT